MQKKSFQALIQKPSKKGGVSYIELPFNAWEVFGKKGRIKVSGKINNHEFRRALIPKGKGRYILTVTKKCWKHLT